MASRRAGGSALLTNKECRVRKSHAKKSEPSKPIFASKYGLE